MINDFQERNLHVKAFKNDLLYAIFYGTGLN